MHNRAFAFAIALTLTGCGAESDDRSHAPLPTLDRPRMTVTATPEPKVVRRAARPLRIEIPAIGVDAPLIRLGLDAHGALEVPKRFDVAGWWTGGPRAGGDRRAPRPQDGRGRVRACARATW